VMILLQLVFTYVPFMQSVFSTAALRLENWGVIIATGTIVLIVAELDKYRRLFKSRH